MFCGHLGGGAAVGRRNLRGASKCRESSKIVGNRLCVGNLSFSTTRDALEAVQAWSRVPAKALIELTATARTAI
jgi:hypothetical protein